MVVPQPKTVVIHAHGMVAAMSTNVIVQMLSKKLDFQKISTIQFIPNGRIRVTCKSVDYRNSILAMKSLLIDGIHQLQTTELDSPITSVYVHYLPPEADDVCIRLAFLPFGKIVSITKQHFSGFKQIATGTRIVVCRWSSTSLFSAISRGIRVGCGTLVSPLSVQSVRVRIKLLTVLTKTSVSVVICLVTAPNIVRMRGELLKPLMFTLPLIRSQPRSP